MDLKQYQIILVNLDPTIGSEMKKTRPYVIISPDEMNKYLKTVIIAPLTHTMKNYPSRVEVKHNHTKGWVVIDQIRTIDRKRVAKILCSLNEKEINKVKSIIKETFVD